GKGTTVLKPRPRGAPGRTAFYAVRLSADGTRAALSRCDSTLAFRGGEVEPDPKTPPPPADVTVWDVASQKELLYVNLGPTGENSIVHQLLLSPDGATVAVIQAEVRGNDQRSFAVQRDVRSTVRLFDVATGNERPPIAVPAVVQNPRFSPDGKRLAGIVPVRDQKELVRMVAMWDVARGAQVYSVEQFRSKLRDPNSMTGFQDQVNLAAWSPDGTRLVISATRPEGGGGTFHVLDAATGKLVRTVKGSLTGMLRPLDADLVFSPDGRRLAGEGRTRFGPMFVRVLDFDSGKELLSLPVT